MVDRIVGPVRQRPVSPNPGRGECPVDAGDVGLALLDGGVVGAEGLACLALLLVVLHERRPQAVAELVKQHGLEEGLRGEVLLQRAGERALRDTTLAAKRICDNLERIWGEDVWTAGPRWKPVRQP